MVPLRWLGYPDVARRFESVPPTFRPGWGRGLWVLRVRRLRPKRVDASTPYGFWRKELVMCGERESVLEAVEESLAPVNRRGFGAAVMRGAALG